MGAVAVRQSDWFVYILECSDSTLYTGIATDVEARLLEHNAGRGAKYTRARLPVTLVYTEKVEDRSAALRREHAIKRLRSADKRDLVRTGLMPRILERAGTAPGGGSITGFYTVFVEGVVTPNANRQAR